MLNKTELMALEWLKNQGYKEKDIIRVPNQSPDFLCMDGKRYEVKFLYGNKIIFYSTQVKNLKDDDIILVFDRDSLITKFLWKDRDKVPLNIKILVTEGKIKLSMDKDVVNSLIKLKKVGDSYSDVVRKLLKECKNGKKKMS